jgi:hypothetical protein
LLPSLHTVGLDASTGRRERVGEPHKLGRIAQHEHAHVRPRHGGVGRLVRGDRKEGTGAACFGIDRFGALANISRVFVQLPRFRAPEKICASVAPSAGLVVALSAPVPRGVPPDDAQAMNTHANATIASPERCTSLSAVKVAATMVATPG